MELAQYMMRDNPRIISNRQDDWIHPVLTLLVVLIIAGVVIYLIRAVTNSNDTSGPTEARAPIDIAKERYAKGEITKDELSEIKKELK